MPIAEVSSSATDATVCTRVLASPPRRADDSRLLVGACRRFSHGLCRRFQFGQSRRHQADELTNRRVEAIGKRDQRVALLDFAPSLQLCLLRFQRFAQSSRSGATPPAFPPCGRSHRRVRSRRPLHRATRWRYYASGFAADSGPRGRLARSATTASPSAPSPPRRSCPGGSTNAERVAQRSCFRARA